MDSAEKRSFEEQGMKHLNQHLSHDIVSAEIVRLLTAQPGTRYSDLVDLMVLHLACPPGRVKSAIDRMRNEEAIVASGRRRFMVYHLPEQVAGSASRHGRGEVIQRIVPASVKATKATNTRPRFTSAIAQFVYEAGL
jgi:hypothetical protein